MRRIGVSPSATSSDASTPQTRSVPTFNRWWDLVALERLVQVRCSKCNDVICHIERRAANEGGPSLRIIHDVKVHIVLLGGDEPPVTNYMQEPRPLPADFLEGAAGKSWGVRCAECRGTGVITGDKLLSAIALSKRYMTTQNVSVIIDRA